MKMNRHYKVIIFVILFSIISPAALPISNTITAEAATITISKKTLVLNVGESSLLSITGTQQKVTWSTSDKAIATVTSSGKVTAVKVGKATVTASVNRKNYSCIVTVNEAVSINQKEITLEVGQSETLKISGVKQSVTWSSSDIKIATVTKSGAVTALKEGEATITAEVNKNKYNCKVIVINPVNPYIVDAPFDAQEITTDDFEYVIPSDWYYEYDGKLYSCPNEALEAEDTSSVEFYIYETGIDTSDYSIMKPILEKDLSEDKVTSDFSKDLISSGIITEETPISYTDFKTSDFNSTLGTAFKVEFNILLYGSVRKEAIYYLFIDSYSFILYTDDIDDNIIPDALTVGEYILSSMHLKESFDEKNNQKVNKVR